MKVIFGDRSVSNYYNYSLQWQKYSLIDMLHHKAGIFNGGQDSKIWAAVVFITTQT